MLRFSKACKNFLNEEMRDLQLTNLQFDELKTFCRKKQWNVKEDEPDRHLKGEMWLFVALDEQTRLVPAYRVGKRDMLNTLSFVWGVRQCMQMPKPHDSDAHNYKEEGYKPVDRPKFCGRSVVLTRERVCCAWKG
jgi:hypothetical protein